MCIFKKIYMHLDFRKIQNYQVFLQVQIHLERFTRTYSTRKEFLAKFRGVEYWVESINSWTDTPEAFEWAGLLSFLTAYEVVVYSSH